MNIQAANFDDILSYYFYATDANEALDVLQRKIERGKEKWLKRMLRDYREDPIYDPDEVAFRDGVDALLTFCNVVEYAATGRLINMQPSRHWSWLPLSGVLRNVHVRKYYRDFYPDRLPQLLLYRIDGKHEAVEEPGAENHCRRFLTLDWQFEKKHRSGYLLKLLDDFTIEDIRFSDVTERFEAPDGVIKSLLRPYDKKKAIDEAVIEFSQFLSFCGVLNQELEDTTGFPLLQAEAWSRYAYWFEIIEPKMNRRLGRTLNKFVTWKPPQGGQEAEKEIQDFVATAKSNLQKLFSREYSSRINTILTTLDSSQTS